LSGCGAGCSGAATRTSGGRAASLAGTTRSPSAGAGASYASVLDSSSGIPQKGSDPTNSTSCGHRDGAPVALTGQTSVVTQGGRQLSETPCPRGVDRTPLPAASVRKATNEASSDPLDAFSFPGFWCADDALVAGNRCARDAASAQRTRLTLEKSIAFSGPSNGTGLASEDGAASMRHGPVTEEAGHT